MVDSAKFEFDVMQQLTNRVRGGHEDMADLQSTQYARNTAAGEGAYRGAVLRAFQDTGDNLNQNYVSKIVTAHTTVDDNWQTTTSTMAAAQDSAVARFINPGS